MRSFLQAAAALVAVILVAAPARAGHHYYQRVPVGGYYMQGGVSAQSLAPGLFSNLIFPSLWNNIPAIVGGLTGGQINLQLPTLNPNPAGGSLTSTPVAPDVAGRLKDVDSDLTRILKASQALQKPKVDTTKPH